MQKHLFNHAGRQWRIFTRSQRPDAHFYIELRSRRGEERKLRSLETSSIPHAVIEARSFIDAWLKGRRDERSGLATRARQHYSTVADLESALPGLTIKAKPRTRAEYLANLRRVLGHALPGVDNPSLGQLTDAAAANFFGWVEMAANALTTQQERHRCRRSWVSMFTTASALFAPRAVYQLTKAGLILPDLTPWRNAVKIHGPQLPRDSGPAIPDDSIIRRTLAGWVTLGRTPGYVCRSRSHRMMVEGRPVFEAGPLTELDRRNMFLAIGLELACGLRKSETSRAKWGWIKSFSGLPHLSERNTEVKNATGEIHLVPIDPFWNFMLTTARRNGWIGGGEDTILLARTNTPPLNSQHSTLNYSIGGHTDATHWPFVHIGWWLRDLGWQTMKTNHALRDFTASHITMRYSLADASEWCRHSSIATTQASYSRFVQQSKRVNTKKLAWLRWAK